MKVLYNNLRHRLHDLLESSLSSSSVRVIDYRGMNRVAHHPIYDGSTYDGGAYLNQSLGIKALPSPSEKDMCSIKFYENSNLKSIPLSFYYLSHFDSYLRSRGIFLLSFERNRLLDNNKSYVCCVPNHKNIVIAQSTIELSDKLNSIAEFSKSYT